MIRNHLAKLRRLYKDRHRAAMDCRTFTDCIPAFLNDDLDDELLDAFLAHRGACSECEEELSIRVLVEKGLEKLDTGGNFHLKNEIAGLEQAARIGRAGRARLAKLAYVLEGAAILAALSAAVTYFRL